MGQGDRDNIILGFKKGSFPVLVATDVAGTYIHIYVCMYVCMYDMCMCAVLIKSTLLCYLRTKRLWSTCSPLVLADYT